MKQDVRILMLEQYENVHGADKNLVQNSNSRNVVPLNAEMPIMDKTPIILVEKLLSLLPYGSGIDYDWKISIAKNGNIQCRNFFHAMNEHGYYDGVMPFTVFIFREKHDQFNPLFGSCAGKTQVICRKNDISFSIRCDDSRRNSFYGLKDYLSYTIHYFLESILTHRNETIPTPEKE